MLKKYAFKKYIIVFLAIIALMLNFTSCKNHTPTVYEEIVYASSITCNSATILNGENKQIEPSTVSNGIPIFVFDFIPNENGNIYTKSDTNNPNVIQLNIEVLPHNANTQKIMFEYDEESYNDIIILREDINAFVFLVPNKLITVTVKTTDGTNISTTVKIICMKKINNL